MYVFIYLYVVRDWLKFTLIIHSNDYEMHGDPGYVIVSYELCNKNAQIYHITS